MSQGIGGDLAHYAQDNGSEPQIPLGTVGTIALGGKAALPWQVVGYVERCEIPEDDEDEQTFWREYLLYHRIEGFAFIVDAEDGWSWATPITGAPQVSGDSARHEGVTYRKLYDYTGQVTYVLGEFYWRLTRDQRTANTDYAGTGAAASEAHEPRARPRARARRRSSGRPARRSPPTPSSPPSGSATTSARRCSATPLPTSFSTASRFAKIIFWGFLLFVVLVLFRCGDDSGKGDCTQVRNTFGEASQEYQSCLNSQRSGGGYRSGGGAFGGFSSGGGHK